MLHKTSPIGKLCQNNLPFSFTAMIDPKPAFPRWPLTLLVLLATTGCSVFQRGPDLSRYETGELGMELSAADSAGTYLAVRQAQAQNSVVLQVVGDEEPHRILPLPTGGKSVFVSNLLQQTGVLEKLDNIDVVLYRPNPQMIGGMKMVVKLTGDQVRPECDYALQPGDRLQVTKVERDTFQMLMDMTLVRS